jgi:hypothetical protein
MIKVSRNVYVPASHSSLPRVRTDVVRRDTARNRQREARPHPGTLGRTWKARSPYFSPHSPQDLRIKPDFRDVVLGCGCLAHRRRG